ncbi:hypothetical protein CAPTEDRAFT_58961, partial [Capitella teleta]
ETGSSALHFACAQGNLHMARFLLENDSDVNRRDHSGKSPLHFAFLNVKRQKLLDAFVLLSRGADPNAIDDKGNAPLHYAIQNKQVAIADLLIEFGADVT